MAAIHIERRNLPRCHRNLRDYCVIFILQEIHERSRQEENKIKKKIDFLIIKISTNLVLLLPLHEIRIQVQIPKGLSQPLCLCQQGRRAHRRSVQKRANAPTTKIEFNQQGQFIFSRRRKASKFKLRILYFSPPFEHYYIYIHI